MNESKTSSFPLETAAAPPITLSKQAGGSRARRFFEMIQGLLAWTTIILMFVLSRYTPRFVSIFIILFDIYWLLKTFYLFLHIRATFNAMKENMKKDWLEEIAKLGDRAEKREFGAQDVYHILLLPMYTEPYEVVRESFASLLTVRYPKDKFIVVLAIEERAGDAAREVAQKIQAEFGDKFFKFLVTEHPAGLAGEIPGKGSNEAWAVIEANRRIIDPLAIPHNQTLVSVFDIDTQVYPDYFGRLTHAFLTAEHPLRSVYQPVPLFINNIFDAPALARVVAFSASFWQMIQQSRPERLTTFSSQSIPLQTLVEIGFWNRDVVSEDSRIFWQGYLHYHGDFRVEPLTYPVSMDANVAPTFWGTMVNIYKQQRRWGWGCENIPYMLEGFRKDPQISKKKKWYWSVIVFEGFH